MSNATKAIPLLTPEHALLISGLQPAVNKLKRPSDAMQPPSVSSNQMPPLPQNNKRPKLDHTPSSAALPTQSQTDQVPAHQLIPPVTSSRKSPSSVSPNATQSHQQAIADIALLPTPELKIHAWQRKQEEAKTLANSFVAQLQQKLQATLITEQEALHNARNIQGKLARQ